MTDSDVPALAATTMGGRIEPRPRPEHPKLTAIIACYRDGPAVPIMYRRLVDTFVRLNVDYEIVFVNDASPDEARLVLRQLASEDRRVVVINHSRNFGSQSAFTSGMRLATGDAVILLDGDLQDPPELIDAFFDKWLAGYDVVYGVRTKRETSRTLQVAYKAFYRIFRKSSYVPVPLDAGDFSLIDRRVVQALNSLPENNRFLRGLRAWIGFEQVGVSYTRPERMFGTSTNSWLKNLGWARKAILSFSYAPLELITVLAVSTVLLSLIGIVASIVVRLVRPDLVPSGLTTVIVAVLFIGGIQLSCLSIIGSYLAHIYDEVKRRPPYVVESIWNAPNDDNVGLDE
jgi:dolichol-phosphate mannosyltransferase